MQVVQPGVTSIDPTLYGETQTQFSNFGSSGVMGVASGTGGSGVVAYNSNPLNTRAALLAISEGTGDGVSGDSDRGDGVAGSAGSSSGAGVHGRSAVAGGLGVRAFASGTSAVGMRAEASGANGVALRAAASGSATYAGIFAGRVDVNGNLDVNGTLTKSAGTFKIDNPADPANEYLSHSFVESPEMKNLYDGVVTTDADGFATVTMPEWFDPLNRTFRYQLTVVGRSFARAVVWDELRDGRFRIRTDEPRVKVSWQVTGVREDAYANAHRTPVVERKTGEERGRYLHPELYGRAASRAVR